jgi:coenzyme PQQ biosynthesis protein PqqD
MTARQQEAYRASAATDAALLALQGLGLMATDVPTQRSDVRVRVVDGETVIFDRRRGLIHVLNSTAHFIWERCDGTATIADIAQQLATAFEVDPQKVAADVAAFIAQLHAVELLALQDSSVSPVEGNL